MEDRRQTLDIGEAVPVVRRDTVPLRTLIVLRWIAIGGQISAVIAGVMILGLALPIWPISAAIGAAAVTNLIAMTRFSGVRRLDEGELAGIIAFDMLQLSSLLFFTGGVDNPFALLILAQVAIAAAALGRIARLSICLFAILLITALFFLYLPLERQGGGDLALPTLFRFGFWLAIVIGTLFQTIYASRITDEIAAMSDALTATQLALGREQKLTDLGGVIAAAAHELGTPLSTIALVSKEMAGDPQAGDDLRGDARLIRDQAERCRQILAGMANDGKRDTHLDSAPFATILEAAAEPHGDRGTPILFDLAPSDDLAGPQPTVMRRPELIHGLRNLVQNAVDHAETRVWIDLTWTLTEIRLTVADDGDGYPPDLLPYIGDPYLNRRQRQDSSGMGLGLFIAKTLLERTGADLAFANGTGGQGPEDRRGAVVSLRWRRPVLEPESHGATLTS